jgi:hypothetical protein
MWGTEEQEEGGEEDEEEATFLQPSRVRVSPRSMFFYLFLVFSFCSEKYNLPLAAAKELRGWTM